MEDLSVHPSSCIKEVTTSITIHANENFKEFQIQSINESLGKMRYQWVQELEAVLVDWQDVTTKKVVQLEPPLRGSMMKIKGKFKILNPTELIEGKVIQISESKILANCDFFAAHVQNKKNISVNVGDLIQFKYLMIWVQNDGLAVLYGKSPKLVSRSSEETEAPDSEPAQASPKRSASKRATEAESNPRNKRLKRTGSKPADDSQAQDSQAGCSREEQAVDQQAVEGQAVDQQAVEDQKTPDKNTQRSQSANKYRTSGQRIMDQYLTPRQKNVEQKATVAPKSSEKVDRVVKNFKRVKDANKNKNFDETIATASQKMTAVDEKQRVRARSTETELVTSVPFTSTYRPKRNKQKKITEDLPAGWTVNVYRSSKKPEGWYTYVSPDGEECRGYAKALEHSKAEERRGLAVKVTGTPGSAVKVTDLTEAGNPSHDAFERKLKAILVANAKADRQAQFDDGEAMDNNEDGLKETVDQIISSLSPARKQDTAATDGDALNNNNVDSGTTQKSKENKKEKSGKKQTGEGKKKDSKKNAKTGQKKPLKRLQTQEISGPTKRLVYDTNKSKNKKQKTNLKKVLLEDDKFSDRHYTSPQIQPVLSQNGFVEVSSAPSPNNDSTSNNNSKTTTPTTANNTSLLSNSTPKSSKMSKKRMHSRSRDDEEEENTSGYEDKFLEFLAGHPEKVSGDETMMAEENVDRAVLKEQSINIKTKASRLSKNYRKEDSDIQFGTPGNQLGASENQLGTPGILQGASTPSPNKRVLAGASDSEDSDFIPPTQHSERKPNRSMINRFTRLNRTNITY